MAIGLHGRPLCDGRGRIWHTAPVSSSKDALDDLRLADILTLLAVRRCSSVTGAARELQVSPSQVSKAIARLEEQFQVTILARGARGVSLSEAGSRIIPHLSQVVDHLRSLRGGDADPGLELTVAAPSFLLTLFLPSIACCLENLRVRGLELPPALVRAYAAENFFDITLTIGTETLAGPWVSERLGQVRKALFGPPALARRLGPGKVPLPALSDIPFIHPIYSASGHFVPIDDGCPLHYSQRTKGHGAQTIGLGLELAMRTGQLIFGPAIAARRHVELGTLVEIPVAGWEVSEALYVVCDSQKVLARVHRAIVAALHIRLAELTAG